MKIKEIEIKGWRSFDSENGIVLKDLKRINVLIGPNNSGKSNISKFFHKLKDLLKDNEQRHFRDGDYAIFSRMNHTRINNNDTWSWAGDEIKCNIKVNGLNKRWYSKEPYLPIHKTDDMKLTYVHNVSETSSVFSVEIDDKALIKCPKKGNTQVLNIDLNNYVDFNSNLKALLDTVTYWAELSQSIVFIDPIRHYNRKHGNDNYKEYYFEGHETLSRIKSLQIADELHEWSLFQNNINKWLQDLLNEKIEFRLDNDEPRFIIKRNGKDLISRIDDVGTGVSQLFMILAFLFINRHKQLNVFIDEPEANLHPEAVKVLVRIFERDFKNHTFFITTHSSSLIDEVSSDWSIHRVIRSGENSSKILPCNSIVAKYEVLDDLGIRASQLLQSNLIIWVEGPSDRIYINKWIKDLVKIESPNIKIQEGKHYSFLMYGGSNLSTHTILSEENNDNIDILCTSRYAVIVCDSDYKTPEDETNNALKDRVKAIYQRLNEVKQSEIGHERNINNYIKFWITEGRETENYIPQSLLSEILSSNNFKKYRFNDKKEVDYENLPNLNLNISLIENEKFDKFDAFDEFFTKMYCLNESQSLSETQKKNIAKHYSGKKVDISKEVILKWKDEHYESNLDLKKQVIDIIQLIKVANGL